MYTAANTNDNKSCKQLVLNNFLLKGNLMNQLNTECE